MDSTPEELSYMEQLLASFKRFILQLEDVKAEMPKYQKNCKSMITLAGAIDAALKDNE